MWSLYDTLVTTDAAIYVILIVLAIRRYRSQQDEIKAFMTFFVLVGIIQSTSVILSYFYIENLYLFPVYICVQLLTLGRFYVLLWTNQRKRKAVQLILLCLLCLFGLELVFWLVDQQDVLTWYSHFTSSIFYALLSLIILIRRLESNLNQQLLQLNVGILFYFSLSALFFLFGNFLLTFSGGNENLLWNLNVIVHMVFLLIVAPALWKRPTS